ncbi:hypothetical protein [Halorarius halobius]|uniref:hypothetical protein n=1 Tax=Halorarius halobius TaxID=2962671 RepID=UPI0020CE6BB9|nr:hypothetical protein [Halorarius halobius]
MAQDSRSGSDSIFLTRRLRERSALVVSTVMLMALLNALFAAWNTLGVQVTVYDLHLMVWAFLVVGAATLAYYSYKQTPSAVLGVGCYVLAVQVLLKPVILYGSQLAAGRQAAVAEGSSLFLGGAIGLFLWVPVAVVLAALLILVGRFFHVRDERVRLRSWRDTLYAADD